MADAQDQTSPYLQELDPSPVYDQTPDLEQGYDLKLSDIDTEPILQKDGRRPAHKLGLGGHSWEYWCKSNKLTLNEAA